MILHRENKVECPKGLVCRDVCLPWMAGWQQAAAAVLLWVPHGATSITVRLRPPELSQKYNYSLNYFLSALAAHLLPLAGTGQVTARARRSVWPGVGRARSGVGRVHQVPRVVGLGAAWNCDNQQQ